MNSPSSMKIDSSASEKEKENDVVARKNRKRSRAVVTPAGNTLSVEDKVNGTWQQYEDEYIVSMVNQMGFGKWKEISESGLQHRLPKHIRARFVDVLDPQRKPKYTPWTDREDQILLEHQQEHGNQWAAISKKLPGRTTNDIKNRFHNRGGLKKALQGKRKGKENSTSTQTRTRTTISESRDILLPLLPGIAATATATLSSSATCTQVDGGPPVALSPLKPPPPMTKRAATTEKENDVVARTSKKRSSAAINHRSGAVVTQVEFPTECDILCEQSRPSINHMYSVGNETYQSTLDTYATRYDNATSNKEKRTITKEIVACIHETGGRFLKYKKNDRVWEEISIVAARDKISHALRTKIASWKKQQRQLPSSSATSSPPLIDMSPSSEVPSSPPSATPPSRVASSPPSATPLQVVNAANESHGMIQQQQHMTVAAHQTTISRMEERFEKQLLQQQLYYEKKIRNVQASNSAATLASILDTAAPAVPTEFLSSFSGIGDDVVLKFKEWSMQCKKIWSATLQAHGAAKVDLERLFLPQIYKFCHNKQPIQIVLHSSFGPFGELEGMAFFEFFKVLLPQTSFVVVDQIPIAAPYNIGYLGQKNQAATILGVEDHLKIMNGLSSIFREVGTDAIILGLGDAGRYSANLPDILDDSTNAAHPCIAYGSFTGMTRTFNSNFSYAQLYTKLFVGDLTEAQGRIAVKVLQLQGERLAYTTRPTNVAMIEKQQNAWNSVEPIINKLRALHQADPVTKDDRWNARFEELKKYAEEHNGQLPSQRESKLGSWVKKQLAHSKTRALHTAERKAKLRSISSSFRYEEEEDNDDTAASTVPIEKNITSTTDGDSLVDNDQTRKYAEASAHKLPTEAMATLGRKFQKRNQVMVQQQNTKVIYDADVQNVTAI